MCAALAREYKKLNLSLQGLQVIGHDSAGVQPGMNSGKRADYDFLDLRHF